MRRTRKLVVAGCLCAAITMGSTAYAMPGATSLVAVTPKTTASATSDTAKKETNGTGTVAAGAAALTAASNVSVNAKLSAEKDHTEESAAAEQVQPADAAAASGETAAETESASEPSPYANVAVSQVGSDEDYVNIRDAASTEGEILGKIYNNCAATIEETVEAEDGTWYKIHSGSVEGYIKAEYFVTGDEAEELALQIGKMFGYVEEGGLRVRKEPNTESDIITRLYSGEIYTVVERTQKTGL